MESCKARLVSWNKLELGHVGRKIAEIQKRLQTQVLIKIDTTSREIEVVCQPLNSWLDAELVM